MTENFCLEKHASFLQVHLKWCYPTVRCFNGHFRYPACKGRFYAPFKRQ